MSKQIDTRVTVTAGDLAEMIITAHHASEPLMIHGSPGIGKSAQALDAAGQLANEYDLTNVKELGDVFDPATDFGYFDIRLINMGPEEFGLPNLDRDRGVQVRNPVDWFPSTDRTDLPEHGLLVFEEAVSASPAMQATMYQITHDRRLGDKKLKSGWSVVLTGNLMTDGGVVHKMPTPLSNRLVHIYVRSDNDSWHKWAVEHDIEPVLLGFLRFRPELLNTFEKHVESKSKDHAFATERTWEKVHNFIKRNPNVHPAMLAGTVGNGPATEFNAFREIWQQMPNIDGILMDPKNAKVPEDTAVRYAVCTALGSRVTKDNFDLIVEYVERMPPEFTMMTIKDCVNRKQGEVTCTKAFAKVVSKYADYLN